MHTALSSCLSVQWTIIPEALPIVKRPCGRCHKIQPFYCAEKFRINGHHQRLDAWLIYRCSQCDHTWNFTLYTRVKPSQIGLEQLVRMEANDSLLAREYAFDLARLKQAGAHVEPGVAFTVEETVSLQQPNMAERLTIQIVSTFPVSMRLEKLLQTQWKTSRKQIRDWHQQGILLLEDISKKALRKSIANQTIQLIENEETQYIFDEM